MAEKKRRFAYAAEPIAESKSLSESSIITKSELLAIETEALDNTLPIKGSGSKKGSASRTIRTNKAVKLPAAPGATQRAPKSELLAIEVEGLNDELLREGTIDRNNFASKITQARKVAESPKDSDATLLTSEPELLAKLAAQHSGLTLQLGSLETMVAPPQRRGRPDTAGEGRMAVAREQLNVRIIPELKRAAGAVAALQGLTLGDIVEKALLEYITKEK